ncbi:MAG: hypothetical protein AB7L66_17070 [Gemmatimonadales bacterium]
MTKTVLSGLTLLGAGLASACYGLHRATGPDGIVETATTQFATGLVNGVAATRVDFRVTNLTRIDIALWQCPNRPALRVERQNAGVWTALPDLRCDGAQAEHQVGLADAVGLPGSFYLIEPGTYRITVVLTDESADRVDAPPSNEFVIR